MKLYLIYIVKGPQVFHIGDNIKNYLDPYEFKTYKKLLDWGTDFTEDFREAGLVVKYKEGYFDTWNGKYVKAKSEKELINSCMVICTARGVIKGIMCINKNNREEL